MCGKEMYCDEKIAKRDIPFCDWLSASVYNSASRNMNTCFVVMVLVVDMAAELLQMFKNILLREVHTACISIQHSMQNGQLWYQSTKFEMGLAPKCRRCECYIYVLCVAVKSVDSMSHVEVAACSVRQLSYVEVPTFSSSVVPATCVHTRLVVDKHEP